MRDRYVRTAANEPRTAEETASYPWGWKQATEGGVANLFEISVQCDKMGSNKILHLSTFLFLNRSRVFYSWHRKNVVLDSLVFICTQSGAASKQRGRGAVAGIRFQYDYFLTAASSNVGMSLVVMNVTKTHT